MITINYCEDLKKTKFENIEHKHLSLLLLMKKAQSFFFEIGELLGDKDSYHSLEKLYNKIPSEILNDCGYKKNINGFNSINSALHHLSKANIYNIAISTEFKNLPNIETLGFLKVTSA